MMSYRNQEQMCNKVAEIYQPEKAYKAISNVLGLQ